ncbi:4-(cytidine 5'-diphospho)-2-C-methyl-D-erythritol kinase [Rhizobium sp. CSW-27]|uniref:4-(cytidine 5'-diphospho)-2-C-methyl-D-erythritol kinase n=1 Tax=Rhizobium sp. CSW-27 TaxID=2839985 RepID=UPI001C031593|nr:4-(cytidine 5'-diphospho)-2-C-methyl-D-erythritol kinase [Rhizobium sp. CSW-27]MBT9368884.1 4-(cytidine 5'-diphospho)-2-C-methyl-D-erythritol kinase [Rhizobium sp. CSW-27]
MTGSIRETAPAKINLALHVTGRRADGYHLLDSLVTFAGDGDSLELAPASQDGFRVTGRFGALLGDGQDNLVVRARDLLRSAVLAAGHAAPPVEISLDKALPVASGIGGGSADAAATLRGLARLWGVTLPQGQMQALALSLGADVPMCLASRPVLARGIGEELTPVAALPALALVLVNPLVSVSTPDIFRRLETRDNPPMTALPATRQADWTAYLRAQRNDLEPPARALVDEIAAVSTALASGGAELVRMSGSGATCFGLFASPHAAAEAAARLTEQHPLWYVQATTTIAGE